VFYIAFGFKGWVAGFALSRIIGVGLYLRFFRRWLLNPVNRYEWLKMAKASLPFYLRGYMRFGLLQLDQLVIGIFMSPATLSAYYIARSIAGYVDLFIEATGKPLLVKTAELKNLGLNAVSEGLRKMSRYQSFTFVPICFGVAAFGRPVLEIFGGTKYLNAYPLLIIFCLTALVKAVWSEIYVRGVFIVGQPRDTLMVDVVGCLMNTVSLIVLIKLLGALGVAVSLLISAVSVLIAAFVILNGAVDFYFDKGGLFRSMLAAAAPLILAMGMQIFYYDLFLMPVYASVSFLLYLLVMIRLFEDQDIMLLESVLTGRSEMLPRILHWCGMPQIGRRTS
jgi:O-antigen/teichoic acid export membrane protein